MKLEPSEILPGLVVYCDPHVLAADPETSATDYVENCVQGPHFFIVLRRLTSGRWLITPAFSRMTADRVQLEQRCKAGPSRRWREHPSHVYLWEHWLAPPQALIAASELERTEIGARNSYAARDPKVLDRLASFFDVNERPLIDLRDGELASL